MMTKRSADKLKLIYKITPHSPIFLKEFGFYSIEKWVSQGFIKCEEDLNSICGFDPPGNHILWGMGGCSAPFIPEFEEKILEDKGAYELIRDSAGRKIKAFKGRRSGYMPEYMDHPVKDFSTWESECKWRMISDLPERIRQSEKMGKVAADKLKATGCMITQYVVGGYMYLRSLIGPENLLYMFYDMPELIHECMKSWLDVAQTITSIHQKYVPIDELLFDEDICYNTSSLISPDMISEFLMPYYEQLINDVNSRNPKGHILHSQLASDGHIDCVLAQYKNIGFDVFSPFEVAAGCDVVKTGLKYPDIIISGGIDKRILADSKDSIDKMLDTIMPVMVKRGGYIPTCDHGVPEEVPFENYIHFRKRLLEYSF